MKRLTTLLMMVAVVALTTVSCQKDPDFDELTSEFVTYTDYKTVLVKPNAHKE